ncbi:MAG TPA: undecaprenyl-phosphate glucose phosphotransferase [Methanobacterium sp.]|nr:undecaprenyl-phosphate glucose phosphotransferase [Methanobacterium sp.]
MIRENQRILNLILVIIDITVITFSLVLAWCVRFGTDLLGFGRGIWGFEHYITPIIFIIPAYILIYHFLGLYTPQRTQKTIKSEVSKIIQANIIGLLFLTTLLFIFRLTDYSRYMLVLFILFSTIFSVTERFILRQFLKYVRAQGYNIKYILIIGAAQLGKKFSKVILQNEYMGYRIIGFVDDDPHKATINGFKILGKVEDLENVIEMNTVDRVVVALSQPPVELMEWIIETCEKIGVRAEIIPDYYRYLSSKPHMDIIEDIPLIKIRNVPLDNHFNQFKKRLLDLLFVIPSLIILSPLLLITAILVKLSSPGPVIFKQERLGKDRQVFNMYKFRSMKIHDEEKEKYKWTTKDDPRITSFGSLIRKTSIDELPQLINILKGEMSLIGPRPERPLIAEKFKDEVSKYMIKHHVRPGMTGWAQINGYRGNTSIHKRIEHDIHYVENWTLSLDVEIFFKTLINIFRDRNAY